MSEVQELLDALSHLLGRFVCERNGKDVPRRHAFLSDQIGNAMSNDARLARARSGKDEKRRFGVLYRYALFVVETG